MSIIYVCTYIHPYRGMREREKEKCTTANAGGLLSALYFQKNFHDQQNGGIN
jgi:hypothetical protein